MDEVTTKILAFFHDKGIALGSSPEEILDCDYVDRGLIDSVGIVDLVLHVESAFSVRLDAQAMGSAEVRTVRGMSRLVGRELHGKAA